MKFWGWFSQRISGLILIILLAVHVYLTHFAAAGEAITYFSVQERVNLSAILLVDILLLYLGLYHGLYGLRVVLTDQFPKWNNKVLTLILAVAGLSLSIYGTTTLIALIA